METEHYILAFFGFLMAAQTAFIIWQVKKNKTSQNQLNTDLRADVNETVKKLRKETPRLTINKKGEAVLTTYTGEEILNYKLSKKN